MTKESKRKWSEIMRVVRNAGDKITLDELEKEEEKEEDPFKVHLDDPNLSMAEAAKKILEGDE